MNTHTKDSDALTAAHDALTSTYRRQILGYLVAAEDDVTAVAELVEALRDHDGITDDRSHVAVTLHHVALPTLAAQGFVEYDDRSRTVRYRKSSVLERVLRRSGDAPAVA